MLRSIILVAVVALSSFSHAGEKFTPSDNEAKLLELTNAERTKEELPPLKFNPLLGKVARAHSENMARHMKMEHKLDDKTPFDRLDAAGYDFMRAAENIAFGDEDAKLDMIMKMWMDSKGHRANIMNKDLTEIGIGIARGKDGFLYYTQVFGRPFKK
jgi:uncharacterized protein YkwD